MNQTRLMERLEYNPLTGIFTWKVASGRRPEGSVAGSNFGGYTHIRIDNKRYSAHHLAWLYTHGAFPKDLLDHINGNPLDNRIANIREADHRQNAGNVNLSQRNHSGARGVSWFKRDQKWRVRLTRNGKDCHIGLFETKQEAIDAYAEAAKEFFGEFVREDSLVQQSCGVRRSSVKMKPKHWPVSDLSA